MATSRRETWHFGHQNFGRQIVAPQVAGQCRELDTRQTLHPGSIKTWVANWLSTESPGSARFEYKDKQYTPEMSNAVPPSHCPWIMRDRQEFRVEDKERIPIASNAAPPIGCRVIECRETEFLV
jgi:hypothetical protein